MVLIKLKQVIDFVADNTGEATPLDWYNARFSVDFKVNQLAAGANLDADGDNMGIVNGSSSLIEKLSILANGRDVYSCNYANHVVNIKNLLEYNPSYAESVATNEFFYLDTSRNAAREKYTERQVQHGANDAGNAWEARNFVDGVSATYYKGFAIRKVLLGDSATVRCEIRLNRYSFFETLENKLLPNTKIELNIELESDNNLIWRTGGNDCRVVLTRFQLFVPRITFNSEGQKLYMENYLKPYKWVYLNEVVERSNNSQQQTGHFRITNAQNLAMSLFLKLTQPILIHKQQIHFYTILLSCQTMLIYLAVISRLEMEMSTLIFTLNQLQIQQEFSEK